MQASKTFQSPRGDFGFLKTTGCDTVYMIATMLRFNPLAGILVF